MATRLTGFSRFLITLLILGLIAFAGYYLLNKTGVGAKLKDQAEQAESGQSTTTGGTSSAPSGAFKDAVKVGVVTWGGYAGGQYFNEGFKANSRSRFVQDYGFPVEFKILDDVPVSREAWKNDEVNLLWCTVDALPTEIAGLSDFDPVVVFQADWSRGGDALVARRGINSVNDLRGKKIAVAEMTPSHSFLIWMLEAANLKATDVQIVKQASAIDAAQVFKSQQVDAAVVWSPDDQACLQAVAGSRILQSTKSASNIIADAFIAKRSWVEQNRDKMQKLYEGWMKGAAEINANDDNKRKAAKILAENFSGFTEDDAYAAINNVRLATHGDNQNFFGLNPDYKGVTGEQLYTRMTNSYKALGYAEGRIPNWRLISDPLSIRNTSLTGPDHAAEGQKAFTKVTEEAGKEKEAIATKMVSITFRSGESALDENAKFIVDKEMVEIAKAFANSRIRVEGNTDNVGSVALNQALSRRRAQAVVDYLVAAHGMNRNRFVVVGNGPDKPVASNDTEEGKAKNRRTDFQLIGE
ncbi:MAG TPA: phosphate ABC transporter substrate-binding/OmpA family protein [Saprospiraceae bacterium]|nr:phosphate ABC transporter substrate-binding/OmpA family protein [Saprospiraceae bacterium]HNT19880.1 phosphate ABC transporter substrate-binding/OmpA family protein [Saprospiraceae bacterium]